MQPQSLICYFGTYKSVGAHCDYSHWNSQVLLQIVFIIKSFHHWSFELHVYPCLISLRLYWLIILTCQGLLGFDSRTLSS